MRTIFYTILFIIIRTVLSAQLIVTQAGSLNTARWAHESQKLVDGRVIAFGGDNCNLSNNIVFNSSEIYNPLTDTWSNVAPMSTPRTDFASAVLHDGRVLAIGGRDNTFTNLATCEIYDVINNLWTPVASLNESRAFHKVVKLYDGRVLVVGGDSNTNTAEIYDPYSNTWTYTDTLIKRHQSGISIAGQGILSGGAGAPTKLESFNYLSNSWSLLPGSLYTGRSNHSSIIDNSNGTMIIFTGESTYKKTESYAFSNNTSYNQGNLLTTINNNKPVVLDNGSFLVYGIGDITAPNNTKCLQLYSSATGSWTAGTYNFVGTDVYGINKLNNGTVLINGGSFSTGNGASNNAILVGLSSYTNCITPDLTLSLVGLNTCYGQNPTVTVQSSQLGVTYEARINENAVGVSTISGNGSDKNITLQGTYLMPGDNIISIVAKKTGCPNYYLNNNVVITASLAITATPTIAPSGTVLACMGDNVILTTNSGYPNYIWSYPQITSTSNTLNVNPNKTVYVKLKDSNGCTSVSSEIVKITAPSSLLVGPPLSLCQNQGAVQFTTNAAGGTWSGAGVSSSGLFDPTSVSTGTYNLTYSKCGLNATKTVSVYPVTLPSYSAAYTTTSICANQSATLQISNSSFGVKYQLRNGLTPINTSKNGTGGPLTFTTTNIAYSTVFNILAITTGTNCVIDSLVTQHYINVKNSTLTKISYDTLVCLGKKALIIIDSTRAGVTYSLQSQTGLNIYSKIGDGDSIAFQTPAINSYTIYNIQMGTPGCSNVYLNQSIRPKINIQTPQAFFAPSKFNIQTNEYISFSNNSPIPNSTYAWNFDAGASTSTSTLTLPDSISYSTLGTKYIKLKLSTPIGCDDSLIQRINVIASVSQGNCSEMGIYSDNLSSNLRGITADKFGNTYAFITTAYSQKNKIYSNQFDTLDLPNKYLSGYPQTTALVKYNSIGVPQWITKAKHFSAFSPGNIATDSIGNIYFTFLHQYAGAGSGGYIQFYSIDDSYFKYIIPNNYPDESVVICKYSPLGKFLWAKSYGETNSDNTQIHIDKSNHLYIRSQRHFNKYDSNGNLMWATGAPAYIDVESIDTDSIGNLYTLKSASISFSKRNPTNNNIILTSNPQIALPGMTTMTFQSHLKVNTNSAYMAGVFKGKMTFAGDTFTVNKDQCCTYVDGYVASSNINTGQHNWLIQIRIKNNFLHIQGMDFKNNMGTVLGYLYNPNDSVFVNNEKISMPQAGYFMFNFDSLGNTFNLTSLYTGMVHSSTIISYNVKNSLTNNNVLIGVKAVNENRFVIKKGDISCISQPVNCNVVNVSSNSSKPIICTGDSVKLFGAGASSYAWSDGITDNIFFTPIATHIYTVTGTLGSCSKSSTINIVVNPLPIVNANATNTAICINNSITLSGAGANTYTWSNGVLNGIAFTPTVSNTYTIIGTDTNGCIDTAVTSVIVNNLPSVTASITDSIICIGSTISLSGNGALTYTWSNGISNGASFAPTASETYTVTGTDSNGCVNIDTKSVMVNALPNLVATSNSTLICSGQTATLSVTGADTYTWSTSQNGATIVVSPTTQTSYTVQGSDVNNCVDTATIIQYVSLCTGISFLDETNLISIYPNPSDGILHIELNTNNSYEMIVIFNTLGEELFKVIRPSHHNTFNLKDLPNGIYFVTVKTEESQITKHIILNR